MKRIHISLFNHNTIGRKTLIDLIDWVNVGFTENGFQVSVAEEDFIQGIPNIIFESNFRCEALLNALAGSRKPFPLIIFATEVILQNKSTTGPVIGTVKNGLMLFSP
jgi:hypothetical protein